MTDYIAELNRGRFRQPAERARQHDSRAIRGATSRSTADIRATQPTPPVHPRPRFVAPQPDPMPPPVQVVSPQPYTDPAIPRQRPSRVLARRGVHFPRTVRGESPASKRSWRPLALQTTLVGMAVVVFIVGMASSLQTLKTNHEASAQVAALVKKANNSKNGNSGVPITTKPSGADFSLYNVAPDMPRYLMIPKLGVDARVLQVGINANGALGTPANVFDTAWYTGSAEPGQPGATLIDGHVSSWSTHGVFYAIKTLTAGDSIQIERGDGTILHYQVVKTQIYNVNNVDMKAALTPITPGVSGLNLITCAGDVIKGTNSFSERVIVFAKQVD
jgi:LPXTG-site transpeptidase (sortase) family protein